MNGMTPVCLLLFLLQSMPSEFRSAEFNRNHIHHWGRLYKAEDVKIEWHGTRAFTWMKWRGF